MRVILFVLFALAIGKIAAQSHIRQQSANNTIINAYREHALAACRHYAPGHGPATPISIKLLIGDDDLNVRLWQTSHSQWSARYQDPIIVIASSDANGRTVCKYDINTGTADARRALPASRVGEFTTRVQVG